MRPRCGDPTYKVCRAVGKLDFYTLVKCDILHPSLQGPRTSIKSTPQGLTPGMDLSMLPRNISFPGGNFIGGLDEPGQPMPLKMSHFIGHHKSNLPTAVQTSLGGSPHRGRIAAPTVPYDLPLVGLMYEYSWYEVPYWYEYLLPACMHAGRQAGMQASRTNLE